MRLYRKVLIVWILFTLLISLPPLDGFVGDANGESEKELENPFKTYYSEPQEITDMAIDSETNTAYLGSKYGLIVKNLDHGEFKVISYFDGLNDSYIEALEMDEVNSRLFVIVKNCNDIFILNLTTNEIDKKYHLHSVTTMVHSAEFKHLYYDSNTNVLYMAEDSGLAAVNLTDGKFDFYDLFFFDVNFSKYEIKGNTIHAEINESFSINGLDYNAGANELYIATSAGLTIFNTQSQEFKNFRATSVLGNEISDVLYVEQVHKLFLGSERLIMYNVETSTILEYPRISWEFYPNDLNNSMLVNQSIRSLSYDPEDQVIFAILNGAVAMGINHGWYGIALFSPYEPKIIRKFVKDEYEMDDSPLYSSFTCLYYNDADNAMYLGFGAHVDSGSEWIIDYTVEKSGSKFNSDDLEYFESITNKKLKLKRSQLYFSIQQGSYGGRLYSYDFDSNQFEKVCLNNSPTGNPYELYNRMTMEVHPETGSIFFNSNYNTLVFNPDLTIFKHLDDLNIHDIEFTGGELAYLATFQGLFLLNISNGSMLEIKIDDISKSVGLDLGELSDKLYISTDKGVVVFDPKTNNSSLYPFPKNIIIKINNKNTSYNNFESQLKGIASDLTENFVYLTLDNPYIIFKLNLHTGGYEILENSVDASKLAGDTYYGLSYGMIEISHNKDEIIIASSMGLIDENIEYVEGFPETGTINSFVLDGANNKLYAVTGGSHRYGGGGRVTCSEFESGLIIFDLQNRTYTNYSLDHGLPSNVFTSIAVDPSRGTIYLTGDRFFAVVNESDLSKNITRKKIPVVVFEPTEAAEQVLGFKYNSSEEDHTLIYLGVAGLSFGTILGFLFIVEPSKYKLMVSFAAPLYTRLKKKKVLDHETRGRIKEKIASDPGIHYNELKKRLKLNNGALAYHLRVLHREGLIKSKNSGRYKHFFPGNMTLPKKFFKMTEVQKIIFKKLIESPGLSQKKITEEIGSSTSTVNYNIKIMVDKGIVEVRRIGKKTMCYIIQENGEVGDVAS